MPYSHVTHASSFIDPTLPSWAAGLMSGGITIKLGSSPPPPLIDPRLHCCSPQPLGTLMIWNWPSTYGDPVPHKALSSKHACIPWLGSKGTPSCHYSILSPPYTLTMGAEWKLPWIRHVAGLLANPVGSSPLLLNSAGFSRLHGLPKRFHTTPVPAGFGLMALSLCILLDSLGVGPLYSHSG